MLAGTTASGAGVPATVAGANLCTPLPPYMATDASVLAQEVNMVVMYTFADLNMGNWPPPNTTLRSACAGIVVGLATSGVGAWRTLAEFLSLYGGGSAPSGCFFWEKGRRWSWSA